MAMAPAPGFGRAVRLRRRQHPPRSRPAPNGRVQCRHASAPGSDCSARGDTVGRLRRRAGPEGCQFRLPLRGLRPCGRAACVWRSGARRGDTVRRTRRRAGRDACPETATPYGTEGPLRPFHEPRPVLDEVLGTPCGRYSSGSWCASARDQYQEPPKSRSLSVVFAAGRHPLAPGLPITCRYTADNS